MNKKSHHRFGRQIINKIKIKAEKTLYFVFWFVNTVVIHNLTLYENRKIINK